MVGHCPDQVACIGLISLTHLILWGYSWAGADRRLCHAGHRGSETGGLQSAVMPV
ncbi:hypothetical protein GCD22_01866 [Acidithiobacillus thiooxidans ATCC 19377]|uniref:Uncharacterized protein n=1 Tax=Acidithiobacillus thiooxidans ATCC 19377 TaxID=637390 RepID=A0A5P9XRZ2_ACITH|nr:hypothetical protein GCD22_01866 [Acidithiobacillus thiooxidans ATCC 19377]